MILNYRNIEKSRCVEKNGTDYYPHGSVLPGRNSNNNSYRFGYQGQEQDPQTGYTRFDLRQFNALLGRWSTPDPMGQYHSAYLAMGNNPISLIDPTGGQTDAPNMEVNSGGFGEHQDYTEEQNSLWQEVSKWAFLPDYVSDHFADMGIAGWGKDEYGNKYYDEELGIDGSAYSIEWKVETIGNETTPVGTINFYDAYNRHYVSTVYGYYGNDHASSGGGMSGGAGGDWDDDIPWFAKLQGNSSNDTWEGGNDGANAGADAPDAVSYNLNIGIGLGELSYSLTYIPSEGVYVSSAVAGNPATDVDFNKINISGTISVYRLHDKNTPSIAKEISGMQAQFVGNVYLLTGAYSTTAPDRYNNYKMSEYEVGVTVNPSASIRSGGIGGGIKVQSVLIPVVTW